MEIIIVGHAADVRDILMLYQKASGQTLLCIQKPPERQPDIERFAIEIGYHDDL